MIRLPELQGPGRASAGPLLFHDGTASSAPATNSPLPLFVAAKEEAKADHPGAGPQAIEPQARADARHPRCGGRGAGGAGQGPHQRRRRHLLPGTARGGLGRGAEAGRPVRRRPRGVDRRHRCRPRILPAAGFCRRRPSCWRARRPASGPLAPGTGSPASLPSSTMRFASSTWTTRGFNALASASSSIA